jgi:hypothetical protein
VVERELPDAEVVIPQPFWPAYLTAERIAKAKKLKLAVTAGIGSDHSSRRRRERASASLGLPPNGYPAGGHLAARAAPYAAKNIRSTAA